MSNDMPEALGLRRADTATRLDDEQAGKPSWQPDVTEHADVGPMVFFATDKSRMSGNGPPKTSANPGERPSVTRMTRKDRLAEELRANLKRRKAAARRQKEPAGEDEGIPD